MKNKSSRLIIGILSTAMLCLSACGQDVATGGETNGSYVLETVDERDGEDIQREVARGETASDSAMGETISVEGEITRIELSDEEITVDGEAISTSADDGVYVANDIVFYLEGQDFTYGEGTKEQEHSKEEADAHTVVHIAKAGNYEISGTLSKGQIAIDLGEDAKDDKDAVVNLILNNADITCEVAPAVIFYNVYECGDADNPTYDVDTSLAGANVILADGSVNNFKGSHVAKIYKEVELNEAGTEVVDSKKLHKYDGAFYSKMSMNISGQEDCSGILNIEADNEGLGTELHLNILSGNINITAGNDGINTSEDGVSVTTINGGNIDITVSGTTGEGDGIDSNGWLIMNGGSVKASACGKSADSGIDSDLGIHLNGGEVFASGNMLDQIAEAKQNYAVFQFGSASQGGTQYSLKTEDGTAVAHIAPANDFSILLVSMENLDAGNYTFFKGEEQLSGSSGMGGFGGMMGGPRPTDGQMPEGMEKPEGGEMPEGMERPEGGRGQGGRGQNGNASQGEISRTFVIAEGANFFQVVK